jgi:hypothetical protein
MFPVTLAPGIPVKELTVPVESTAKVTEYVPMFEPLVALKLPLHVPEQADGSETFARVPLKEPVSATCVGEVKDPLNCTGASLASVKLRVAVKAPFACT